MRPRAVGGYEPDDREQHELSELWHTSRVAIALSEAERKVLLAKHNGSERSARIAWVVDEFLRTHTNEPNVKFKWVYNWCVEYLGCHVEPATCETRGCRRPVRAGQICDECRTELRTTGSIKAKNGARP